MADSLLSGLGRDLRNALDRGAARTPEVSPSGERWLLNWVFACVTVALTLYLLCGYHAGFERINGLAARAPDWIWEWLTVVGDERVAFALTLFFSRRHPRVFWAMVIAAFLGIAFTHSLKPLFSTLRPPGVMEPGLLNLIGPPHRKVSFPSGHSVTAAVFFGIWVYYARRNWIRALLIVAAVAAGMSRVAVGVHWPVDVAAGLAGGALAAWLGVKLVRRIPWGVVEPSVHLAFVTLAGMLTATLLYYDGGYSGSAGMQGLLGAAALTYGIWSYLVAPLSRRAR